MDKNDLLNTTQINILNATKVNTDAEQNSNKEHVELFFRGEIHFCRISETPFVLGRGADCNMTIEDDMVSRQHCVLGYTEGKFTLTDQSTNGTFIRFGRSKPVRLHNETMLLTGSGCFKLGGMLDLEDELLIHFKA